MNESQKREFIELYDAHADALYRHAYFRVHEAGRAEELVQETFMKAWEHCLREKELPENPKAFLYRVLHNRIIDDYRKKKTVSLEELQESGFEPAAESVEIDVVEIAVVRELLLDLHPKHRDIVVMRFIDGMTPSEIAGITGERENTVSVRVHRALGKLKEAHKKRMGKNKDNGTL